MEFESVEYMDKYAEKDDGRKSRVQEAEIQERTRKEHACSVEGVSRGSDSTPRPYLKLACPTHLNESLSKLQQFQK